MFDNTLVTKYLTRHNLSVIESDPVRPWGGWYIIKMDMEKSEDMKVLRVIPTTLLSLQYHGDSSHPGHAEQWTACTKIRAVVSTQSAVGLDNDSLSELISHIQIIDIEPEGVLHIPAGYIHALANPFAQDIFVIETRTSQIPENAISRENNITRIYDQTNRNNTPSFPGELAAHILDPHFAVDKTVQPHEHYTPGQ